MTTPISVFGLGYVGCVSAACFAKEGFDVVGVDVSPAKIDMIRRGQATILEAAVRLTVGAGLPGGAGQVRPAPGGGSVETYGFNQQSAEAIEAFAPTLEILDRG